MLATVLAPSSGSLRVLGRDPEQSGERIEIRRRLGYLPQSPGLYPGFTAFDLVDYVAVLKEMSDAAERRREVRRVLEAVDLGDAAHRKIRNALRRHAPSRVALASALLGSPPVLLLDEPAAGLDPEQRLHLRTVLSAAGQAGTVLLSTHHTGEVTALCQRVVVMTAGRIRFVGTPRELAAVADGRVWLGDGAVAPGAARSWLTPEGLTRSVGAPPDGVDLVEPTLDDGYLLLTTDGSSR